jgi:hypothetical protein
MGGFSFNSGLLWAIPLSGAQSGRFRLSSSIKTNINQGLLISYTMSNTIKVGQFAKTGQIS